MPDWLQEIILVALGSSTILGGVGWLFKTRREDRLAQEQRIDRLQDKVENLLRDAVAREREYNAQGRERIAMDAQLKEVLSTTITTLKEATAELSRVKRP